MSDTEISIESAEVPGFDDDLTDIDIPGFEQPKTEETSEAQSAAPDADVEADETQEDEAVEAETPPVEAVAAPTAKILQFKAGGKDVALPEDAVVDWKVDGKVTPIKVRDLVDNFAGKVVWERKNQENANERKALEANKQTFSTAQERNRQLVSDMYQKTREGKTFEAVSSLIELTGIQADPREYIKTLREGLMEQAKLLVDMTPEQRKIYEIEEEREYLKSKYERLHQQTTQEKSQQTALAHMATVAEQNKIPYDVFAQHTEFLKQQARAQKSDPGVITPEFVVGYMGKLKSYEMARDAIAAVEPALLSGNKITDEARWDALAKLAEQHKDTVSPEEFVELYKQTRQQKLSADVTKKLEKSPRSTPAKASTRKPARDPLIDARDFSKISEEDSRW